VKEALFLSDKEERILVDIFKNIEREYQSNIDRFTQELLLHIELLLIYSDRFYERQFFTRKNQVMNCYINLKKILTKYFENGNLIENGIPTVKCIAEQMNISPNYLGTLLRLHTLQNTQQHFRTN
jgi:hypothetical protein